MSVPVEEHIRRLHNDIERLEHMVNTEFAVVWVAPENVDNALFLHKPLYTLVHKQELDKRCPTCNKIK